MIRGQIRRQSFRLARNVLQSLIKAGSFLFPFRGRILREQAHLHLDPFAQRRRILKPNRAIFHVPSIDDDLCLR